MDNNVYGIDLGTTNSSIAIYENGEVRILKNIDGSEITPSVVFLQELTRMGMTKLWLAFRQKILLQLHLGILCNS